MSFMNRKNILSEGFFSALKQYLKDRKKMSKTEKMAMRDPKVRKAKKEFDDALDGWKKALQDTIIEK